MCFVMAFHAVAWRQPASWTACYAVAWCQPASWHAVLLPRTSACELTWDTASGTLLPVINKTSDNFRACLVCEYSHVMPPKVLKNIRHFNWCQKWDPAFVRSGGRSTMAKSSCLMMSDNLNSQLTFCALSSQRLDSKERGYSTRAVRIFCFPNSKTSYNYLSLNS